MATVRVQLRRGTEQQWYDANPVLAAGEVGIETDTNTFKFGDGATAWRVLDYALSDTVDDYIPLSTKAVANGVASLDSNGFVPTSQLPPLAKVTVSAVANTAARLALTAEAGDIAIEADSGQSYVLSASPASTDANWKALVGSEAVVDLANDALVASTGLSKTYDDSAGTITFSASSAISTAAADATAKANSAIDTAASDATTKANAAQAAAIANTTTQINNLIDSAPGTLNTLGEIATALAADESAATALTTLVNTKAPLASPTFTGVVTIPSGASISGFAPLAAPTFTGTVTLPASTTIGNVTNVELSYLDGVTSTVQGQIDAKQDSAIAATTYAPLASPTLTGTVTLPESTSIGNVSNLEIGYVNGVTSGIQTQLDAKQAVVANVSDVEIGYLDGVTSAIQTQLNTKQPVVANVSDVEIGHLDGVTSSIQTQIDTKAPLASPTFTGTVTLPANTITQSMISDDSVGTAEIIASSVTSSELAIDSVTEAKIADGAVTSAKIANATIVNGDISASAEIATSKISGLDTALGLLAPIASPTFTGTVSGITKTMVGLGSADNTADTAKPVSTAQAAAIATAKSEVITEILGAGVPAALNTLDELAAALGDDANYAATVTTSLGLKAPLASPTFTGTVTVAAAGVAFTDGTQTKAGIPSLTTIGTEISAAYNLSTGGLALRDQLVPVAGTRAITIPTNTTTDFPIGTSIDFYQASGTGANFVAADGTVTILRTPGLTLRTTYSSATLTKVATNTWLLAGDLTA